MEKLEEEFKNVEDKFKALKNDKLKANNGKIITLIDCKNDCLKIEEKFFMLTKKAFGSLAKFAAKMEKTIDYQRKVVQKQEDGKTNDRCSVMCHLNHQKEDFPEISSLVSSALDSAFYTKLANLIQEIKNTKDTIEI